MKRLIIAIAAWWVAASAYAQGTIYFANRVVGVLDAPVTSMGYGLSGAEGWVAVLYGSSPGGVLRQVGDPIQFRDGPGRGYWPGEMRTIPGVPENGTAQLQVKVFNIALGRTVEEVQAKGLGGWTESEVLASVTTGGGLNPPAPMVGLRGFEGPPWIPEPSITSLVLVGVGALSFWRRR